MKKEVKHNKKCDELIADLQRTRADFENYRKNVEDEKARVKQSSRRSVIYELLPLIDDIERATQFIPEALKDNDWAKGIETLNKKLSADLKKIGVEKICACADEKFNPELHEAVTIEESEGETEMISEELRSGYTLDGEVLRPASVKVKFN